jgi:hypothetical protein
VTGLDRERFSVREHPQAVAHDFLRALTATGMAVPAVDLNEDLLSLKELRRINCRAFWIGANVPLSNQVYFSPCLI